MYRGIKVKRSHRHEHFWQISIQTNVLNRVFDLEEREIKTGHFGKNGWLAILAASVLLL